jgi:hypothetical protein
VTTSDPRIRALAHKAAVQIKALSEAHQSHIAAIYQEFQEQAAAIQEGSADSLDGSSATSTQSTENRQE